MIFKNELGDWHNVSVGSGEISVGCACGWIGKPGQLVNDTCPTCSKEFALLPPTGYCVSKGEEDDIDGS